MVKKEFYPACMLLKDPDTDQYSIYDGSEPPRLEYVQAMFRHDEVAEEADAFVLRRKGTDGTECIVRMPKEQMSYDNELRNTFTYVQCNALDRWLGFNDTAKDFGGVALSELGCPAKYRIAYLPVRLEFPADSDGVAVATVTKPGMGVTLLIWISGRKDLGATPIVRELLSSELPFSVIDSNEASVFCAIEADVKGDGAEAQEAWDAYWRNKQKSIAYHVMVGGYG